MSSLRRLMREATELATSPSPDFHAAPTSDTNLYDWHFTLTGPPSPSLYSNGIYHGRITFPSTYPLRPPSFRFLTPSGRFEVNREICLSISGHHEESWQPAWSVRTALVAIRSFMDADAKGQVGGLDVSDEVRRELAAESRSWCCSVCGRCNEAIVGEWRDGACAEAAEAADAQPQQQQQQQLGQPEHGQPEHGQPEHGQPEHGQPEHGQTEHGQGREQQPASVPIQQPQQPIQDQVRSQEHPSVPTIYYNDPWLDRAIVAVFFALVFMVMRRMLNADMADFY